MEEIRNSAEREQRADQTVPTTTRTQAGSGSGSHGGWAGRIAHTQNTKRSWAFKLATTSDEDDAVTRPGRRPARGGGMEDGTQQAPGAGLGPTSAGSSGMQTCQREMSRRNRRSVDCSSRSQSQEQMQYYSLPSSVSVPEMKGKMRDDLRGADVYKPPEEDKRSAVGRAAGGGVTSAPE